MAHAEALGGVGVSFWSSQGANDEVFAAIRDAPEFIISVGAAVRRDGDSVIQARIVLGAVGMTAGRHDEKHEPVRRLSVREIAEKLDGKETSATAVEVTYEPGQAGARAQFRQQPPRVGIETGL